MNGQAQKAPRQQRNNGNAATPVAATPAPATAPAAASKKAATKPAAAATPVAAQPAPAAKSAPAAARPQSAQPAATTAAPQQNKGKRADKSAAAAPAPAPAATPAPAQASASTSAAISPARQASAPQQQKPQKQQAPVEPAVPSAQLVELERKVKSELRQVNANIDAVYKELDGLLSVADREDLANQLNTVTKTIDDTREKLDEVQKQLGEKGHKSAKVGSQRAHTAERLDTTELEKNLMIEKQRNLKSEVESLHEAFKDIRKHVLNLGTKLNYATVAEVDQELAKVETQLASKKLSPSIIADLTAEKGKLIKQKNSLTDYLEGLENLKKHEQLIKEGEAKLKGLTTELKDVKDKHQRLRSQLTELRAPEAEAPVDALRKQRATLRRQLDIAMDQRRSLRDNFKSKNDGTQNKQQELRAKLESEKQKKKDLLTQTEQFSSQLSTITVEYDDELTPVLIGKSGATINDLRAQTGADIKIKSDKGIILIRGHKAEVDAAKQKIEALLASHKQEATTIKFHPLMVGPIFGNKRAVIVEWRKLGANVSVDASEQLISIRGDTETVAATKAAIEQYLVENAREQATLKFPADMINLVFGKGGETIKAIREQTGSRIDVKRLESALVFEGKKDSVREAKVAYEALIAAARKNEVRIKITEDQIGAVLGKAGAVLREIEESTQATVSLDRTVPCIKIRGEAEAVAAARAKFDVIINESRKETRTVKVEPRDLVGYLLRDKGAKMAEIRNAAKPARVNLEADDAIVSIIGNKEQVELAIRLVNDVLEDGKRAIEGRRAAFEEREKLPEHYVEVTADDLPAIFGARGATIRQISKDSGAAINVDKEACIVSIKGTEEAIAAAKVKIDEILTSEAAKRGEQRTTSTADDDKPDIDYDINYYVKGKTLAPRAPIRGDPTKAKASSSAAAAPKAAPVAAPVAAAPKAAPAAAAPAPAPAAAAEGKGKGKGKKA